MSAFVMTDQPTCERCLRGCTFLRRGLGGVGTPPSGRLTLSSAGYRFLVMQEMNDPFLMRPGDTFVADECGCSFTVESGPRDAGMARQAPRCCCGHEMKK